MRAVLLGPNGQLGQDIRRAQEEAGNPFELVPDSRNCPHAELIEFVPDRPGHDLRYAIDATKIGREMGWNPRETFETGLRKTVEWYLANQGWCDRAIAGIYEGQRLGLDAAHAGK